MNKKLFLLTIILLLTLVSALFVLSSLGNGDQLTINTKHLNGQLQKFTVNYYGTGISMEYPKSWWRHTVEIIEPGAALGSAVKQYFLGSIGSGEYEQFNQPFGESETRIVAGIGIFGPTKGNTVDDVIAELSINSDSIGTVSVGDYYGDLFVTNDTNHEIESARMFVKDYYVVEDNYIYQISIAGRNPAAHERYRSDIDAILNSFEIL